MNFWKSAVAGAGLGPLAFVVFGGAWCLMTHSGSSPAGFILWGMLGIPLHWGAIVPAGIGVLLHAALGRVVSWATCPTAAILLASGISMLAWNAAAVPLRFALSLQTTPEAVRERGGKPEQVPTRWIFIGATATGAAWGIVGGARAWSRSSGRKGDLTPNLALAVAVVCGALAIGVHALFFDGPLYARRFDL